MSLAPPPEAIYPDRDTAFQAIQLHAKDHGYAVLKRSTKPSRVIVACDRAGQYQAKGKDPAIHPSRQRKATGSKKCECLMKVEIRLDSLSSQWMVQVLQGAHNHRPLAAPSAHPAHRIAALNPATRAQIGTLAQAGLKPSQVLTVLRTADLEITLNMPDVGNITQKIRLQELNGRTPIRWLLDVRMSPFYAT
jgi:hypothetical protein